MATRSSIGFQNSNGTIIGVYCHWDGYPEYNGKILFNCYDTEDKVIELLTYGDISSLKPEIGEKHPFDNPFEYGTDEYKAHNEQYGNWCMFYGRDRNEHIDNVGAKLYADVSEFQSEIGQEYDYIFRNGQWLVSDHGDEFVPLKTVLETVDS